MVSVKHMAGAALFAGALLISSIANATSVTGFAVGSVGSLVEVGDTEVRSALGGQEAIRYFIPVDGSSGTFGVNGFGTTSDTGPGNGSLDLILAFEGVTANVPGTLDILFEDLDLNGVNDPANFLESVDVLDSLGNSLTGGPITDISSAFVGGDAETQQLLTLDLDAIDSDPFFVQLAFSSETITSGTRYRQRLVTNTPEFLVATVTQDVAPVPLPATLPLLAAGLIGFGWLGRRKVRG